MDVDDDLLVPGSFVVGLASANDYLSFLNECLWLTVPAARHLWYGSKLLALVLTFSTIIIVLSFTWAALGPFILGWFIWTNLGAVGSAYLVVDVVVILYYICQISLYAVLWGFVPGFAYLLSLSGEFAPDFDDFVLQKGKILIKTLEVDVNSSWLSVPSTVNTDLGVIGYADLDKHFEQHPYLMIAIAVRMRLFPSKLQVALQIGYLTVVLLLWFSKSFFTAVKRSMSVSLKTLKIFFLTLGFVFWGDPRSVRLVSNLLYEILTLGFAVIWSVFSSRSISEIRAFFRFILLIFAIKVLRLVTYLSLITNRYRGKSSKGGRKKLKFKAMVNQTVLKAAAVIDDIALPHFIRTLPERFNKEGIQATFEIMKELGWPVNVELAEPDFSTFKKPAFQDWVISGSTFRSGMRQLQLKADAELVALNELYPAYVHSFNFKTVDNELNSTGRYFRHYDFKFPDLGVDEAWAVVGSIFKDSKLTPFAHIVKKWEKRYGLGPMFMDTSGIRPKKLSRRKAISILGGIPGLLKIWADTFRVAPSLIPISAVSVKAEALPARKFAADVVRTVISSPLAQYIGSTIWNYQTNHNFKYWTTPIKIGMPLNGANLSRLWAEHSTYDVHFAGDFSAFDSTISGKVEKLIRAVRKKGFERHADYSKICFLIDQNYDNLKTHPLAFTSTGNIMAKGGGLSTGHSSTGMDNSIGCDIIYLMIWKDVTGLSAHEFKYYCKLTNYGDDHLLSWLSIAPRVWNKGNIQKSAKRMGFEIRDEEPSGILENMSFLAKFGQKVESADEALFKRLGISTPKFKIWHDPLKLIGKATAPVRSQNPAYRVNRIISYMGLCAHHENVYNEFSSAVRRIKAKYPNVKYKKNIPSYDDVLRTWYNPKTVLSPSLDDIGDQVINETIDADMADNLLIHDYSSAGFVQLLTNVIATLPDILNPAIFNAGYTDWLLSRMGDRVAWPLTLLRDSNDVMNDPHLIKIAVKTPYEHLALNHYVRSIHYEESLGGLYVKHWLFNLFKWPSKWAFKPSTYFKALTNRLASVQFLLNARVHTYSSEIAIPIWDTILIWLLSFVPDFPFVGIVYNIRLPELPVILDQIQASIVAQIWSNIPANFKEARHALEQLDTPTSPLLVEAPTGTGKSTTFIAFINNQIGMNYNKIILVVPRSLLCHTLPPYLRSAFGLSVSGCTRGLILDPSKKIYVTTPNEVFLHTDWLSHENLFIIDEAHVRENAHKFLMKMLVHLKNNFIMVTATPSQENLDLAKVHVPLTIAQVWSVDQKQHKIIDGHTVDSYKHYWELYSNYVLTEIDISHPASKIIVFVIDKAQAYHLSKLVKRKVCSLNSEQRTIDPTASVYICTSVADVGLTIPSADIVISSNLDRIAVNNRESTDTMISVLDPLTANQRRGRTGRTNNGRFIRFSLLPAPKWARSPVEIIDPLGEGFALLQSGVPFLTLSQFMPEFVCKFALNAQTYDRAHDKYIDRFTKSVSAFQDFESEGVGKMLFDNSLDSAVTDLPLVLRGNTVTTGLEKDGEWLKLTQNQYTRFVLEAAKYCADKNLDLTRESVEKYMRRFDINSLTFINFAKRGFNMKASAFTTEIPIENALNKTDGGFLHDRVNDMFEQFHISQQMVQPPAKAATKLASTTPAASTGAGPSEPKPKPKETKPFDLAAFRREQGKRR